MSTPPQLAEDDGIAIVGLAGRFPGARDAASFWQNLCAGVESITAIDEADLEDAFDPATRSGKNFVRARGILAGVDRFDAAFFGMHAREAALTDPQHRLLLETCWEALEDAGCDPAASSERIGIYAGCSISTYLLRHVLGDRPAIDTFASEYQVGSFPALLGGGPDFLATRIAYKLNLRGPAMTVQSACSTSLLAVAQACQTLWTRQADVMLAGAAAISFPQERGYVYQDGGMVSRDGHCRTFDAAASGTVFGAGVGAVVLKRVADARAAGDAIYAVIRGVGINNDGSAKVGYTAPSVEGQAAAVAAAHAMAGFAPDTIDFVECHGTATPLGDPIEVAALARAFSLGAETQTACLLGSVKPNVGHLDIAAGMAGLIKTAFAIRHAKIPPTLHFTTPNPRIDFASTPFSINATLADWPGDSTRRRAGVSAFGVGGTNVHIVLEAELEPERSAEPNSSQLLVVSARTDAALDAARIRLAEFLRANPGEPLRDVALTLQSGRRAFSRRLAISASTSDDAAAQLEAFSGTGRAAGNDCRIGFLFPGQGAQYVGMGRDLYASEPVFREAVDRCAEIVRPALGCDLRTLIYPEVEDDAAMRALTDTAVAQPAIFTIEFALAQLWKSWGIEPVAMLGHSVGEFVAATLARVFSLEDALRVVTERGRLMAEMPPGAMTAVRLGEAQLAPLLRDSLAIAALNAPTQSVVSGPSDAVTALEARLDENGTMYKRIATSHAFHSPMMDALIAPLEALIATMSLGAPEARYVSTVTGRYIEAADAVSPAYWAAHARATVRFGDALATMLADGTTVLLEVGPGTALASAARQGAARETGCAIASSLPHSDAKDETARMQDALGILWTAGARPDWKAMRATQGARRTSLPTYPFEPVRHWVDASEHVTLEDTPMQRVHGSPTPAQAGLGDIERELATLLAELSGETIGAEQTGTSFLELGFDSLFLGRFVAQVQTRFGVDVTFRQLLGSLPSIAALAQHVIATGPPRASSAPGPAAPATIASAAPAASSGATHVATDTAYEAVVRQQLAAMQELMRAQLAALAGDGKAPAVVAPTPVASSQQASPPAASDGPSRFDAFSIRAAQSSNELTAAQRDHIDALVARVSARTAKSKASTQRYRAALADPRVAAGFRSEWKEMVYPIVCDRAKGSRLWDIDGNEYIDILNGFGQTAFGHAPDFVLDAVADQMKRGFAIGPQADAAGEVAELFCAMTGNERMTFCNTGSEAVMAAIRIARTVTGRDRIVMFGGAYHGQFDEVLVKGARTSTQSIPIAPGIPMGSVSNVTVLPYATPESLTWVREHARELAAVIVEPVQSRHPALQPGAFLAELRAITEAAGSALVFDEVVTGFRVHPGGMQAIFGVRADLATYGKVVGGGMPIGVLAGKARFMDALDGGTWQYGDDSAPEVPPTFFAGTFVRHPLTMAAVLAVLRHLAERGPALQEALTARTTGLVERLNATLERRGIASRIETFGSMFYFNFTAEERLAGLLYYHMRDRGIYLQEGFPCFLTTAHTDADVDRVVEAFSQSLEALASAGIFAHETSSVPNIERVELLGDLPPTEEQTEIWLAAQLGDAASCAFNESVTMHVRGELDERAFATAWNQIVARHDALRTVFSPTGETMHVLPVQPFSYTVRDLTATPSSDVEAELRAIVAQDAATPFDAVAGPLVRGRLIRLAPGRSAFVFTVHHIICDGWSMNVILREFTELYAAARRGIAAVLPAAPSFAAYARTQNLRTPAETGATERFWLEQFAEPVRHLDLPIDRARPAIKSYDGATVSVQIDAAHYSALKKAAAKNGCTLFIALLAAYQALLGRLAKRSDVVVGIPAAGQSLLEADALVGHCVNFLPIRTRWNTETRLAELLAETRVRVLDAYEHQSYTFGTLVRKLAAARDGSRLPLTEFQFNLERLDDTLAFAGLTASVTPNAKAFVNFDLFLNVIESADGLRLDCDYNSNLFNRSTVTRWLSYYQHILDAIESDGSLPVDHVTFDDSGESAQLSIVAGPERVYPDVSIHALIEAQVAANPNARAASCGGRTLTYAELDARANQLARHIRKHAGANGKRVGIGISRSLDMLVALIATLKAGLSYVPLDASNPPARLLGIVAQAEVAVLILDATASPELHGSGLPVVDLERDAASIATHDASPLPALADADAAAYVLYTSGSTGAPKGVEVGHRSIVNFLHSAAERPGFTASDVLVAVTTIAFDIAALELYLPLTVGGTVAIATPDELIDGSLLRELIERERATMVQGTPATWRLLLEAGFRAPVGFRMLCGGEAMPRNVADRLLESDGDLWNMYGPTETTIWSTCARIRSGDPIHVGTPFLNTTCYVLDDADRPVAHGVVGQLHIGGAGLAHGYPYVPELTAERFVPDPFSSGLMYRTGDHACLRDDGTIAILGRADDQIKLRGFRIEPGEIETALVRVAGLSAAAVALRDADTESPRLVAYLVPRVGESVDVPALRVALRERLPEYMIPTGWVTLEKLPLNGNGKLDRKALPAPEDRAKSQIASPPMNAIELELAAIWCEVLGRSEIDASDDIFALGADSIQIFAITARANRHGLRILAKDVLQKRTIRAVARSLSEKSVDAGRRLTKAPVSRLVSARERTGTDWR